MSHLDPRVLSPMSRRRLLRLSSAAALAAASGGGAVASLARVRAQDADTPTAAPATTGHFLDAGEVHQIAVAFDRSAYDAMIETYSSGGDKEWLEATVSIDGTTYPRAGMRLKGNSSLGGLRMPDGGNGPISHVDGPDVHVTDPDVVMVTPVPQEGGGNMVHGGGPGGGVSADRPEGLPWLVRLDKYEAGQAHAGISELVIRSNGSKTSLNEAVALELLTQAGLASQAAAASAFTINGGAPALRLAIEHPDDRWMAAHFSADGLLYKSEATGDWTYRGDDPQAYDEVFELEAGGTGEDREDMRPLMAFLDFLNNSDDEAFVAELPGRLDVDRFAVYLAMMDLIDNFDDIDGPGNNAYLYADPATGQLTVVPWDMNLAFAGSDGGRMEMAPEGRPPGGAGSAGPSTMPWPSDGTPAGSDGAAARQDVVVEGRGPGVMGPVPNPLVQRFTAVPAFAAMVEEVKAGLRTALYDSGVAAAVLANWVGVLESGASAMVDRATIAAEAEALAGYFPPT